MNIDNMQTTALNIYNTAMVLHFAPSAPKVWYEVLHNHVLVTQ